MNRGWLKTRLGKCLLGFGLACTAWLLLLWQGAPRLAQWYLPKLVHERSGHALHIGRLQFQPFTWTLTVDDVRLATPSQAPLLRLPHAVVDVAALPLLLGRFQLDSIALDGLQAYAGLDAEGRFNWMDLIAAFQTPEPEPPEPPPNVLLRQIQVRQAVLHWRDDRTQPAFVSRLEPFDLSLANVSTQANAQGQLNLNASTSLDATVKLQTQLTLQPLSAQGQLELSGLNLAKLEGLLQPLLPMPTPQGVLGASASFVMTAPRVGEQTPSVIVAKLNVQLDKFVLTPNQQLDAPRLALDSLTLRQGQLHWPATTLALEAIELKGLQTSLSGNVPWLSLQRFGVGQVAVQPLQATAQVGPVALQGLNLNVQRQSDGHWAWEPALAQWLQAFQDKGAPAKPTPSPTADHAPSKAWRYSLAGFEAKGIVLDYQDHALASGFATGLREGQLTVGGFEHQLDQPLAEKLALDMTANISTGGSLAVQGTVQPQPLQVEANVDVQKLGLPMLSPFLRPYVRLALNQGELNARGQVRHNSSTSRYQGAVSIEDLRLVEVQGQATAIPSAVKRKTSTPVPSAFLSWKRLRATNLELTPSSARIPRLELLGLDTAVLIAADKSTNIGRILVASEPKSASSAVKVGSSVGSDIPPKASAASAFSWQIERFVLQNSEMDFADRSLVLPFGTRIHDLSGSVTGLSNRPGQRGELTLKGAVDDYGLAQASGRLDLLNPTAFTDIKVSFRNVEMTNLTPYSATFANRRINSGKLSLELAYQIQNQTLNSSNRVLIDRLVLGERVQSPNAIDLPLDLAVAILQDANGRIDLGIPVRGTLNDPQFSYGDVVMKALVNVLTKIVTAPFRALAGLFGAEAAPDTVAYGPGQTVLDPPQREQLKRLVQLLETRPKMQLVVHGTWAKADQEAMQARLLQEAVALYNGDKLPPGEDPGPLALESPAVQKALEGLYSKRFGAGALGALKEGFRQTNPSELPSNAMAQAAAQLGQWLRDAKPLEPAELASLKGKTWSQVLADRLQVAQEVGQAQLEALAATRQRSLVESMQSQSEGGKLAGRVQEGSPRQVDLDAQQQVPLVLDVVALP